MCFAEVRPEWGQKGDLSDSEAEARLSRLDFKAQSSLGFPQNGPKKRKQAVSGRLCLIDQCQGSENRERTDRREATGTPVTTGYEQEKTEQGQSF